MFLFELLNIHVSAMFSYSSSRAVFCCSSGRESSMWALCVQVFNVHFCLCVSLALCALSGGGCFEQREVHTLKTPKSHTSRLFYEFKQSVFLMGRLPYSSLTSFCKAKMQKAGVSAREGDMLVVNDYYRHAY